jgi:hypothetical protein
MLVSELGGDEFENIVSDCWQLMSAIALGSDFFSIRDFPWISKTDALLRI